MDLFDRNKREDTDIATVIILKYNYCVIHIVQFDLPRRATVLIVGSSRVLPRFGY